MTEPDRATRLFLQFLTEGRPRCPVCRYDLRGAAGPKCPECGEQLELFLHHSRTATRRTWIAVFSGLAALFPLAVAFLFQLTEPRAVRSGQVAVLGGAAALVAVLAFVLVMWLRPCPPRSKAESSGRRAGRLSLVRALGRDASLWCPVRKDFMRVKDDWCPLCFERIAPAIRTVSPRSLGDDRVVSLRAGIARSSGTALVAVSLVVLFAFATRRDPRGAWLPALMAIVFILCAGVGCWLLLRRQWLVALPERRRWRVEFAARAVAVVATMIVTIAMIAWKAFART